MKVASPRARCGPVDARLPGDRPSCAPGGPLLERVLLDDEPDLLVPALDLLLGADQSRHVRIASSIFGYAPQRQRLPAMRVPNLVGRRRGRRVDERDRADDLARRAEAALQRVGAHERVDHRVVAQPLDRRHLGVGTGGRA